MPHLLLTRLAVAALTALVAAAPAVSQETDDTPQGRFIERKAEGWFWYKDPKDAPKPKLKPVPPKAASAQAAKASEPAIEPFSTKWLQVNMPKLMEKAIDDPTRENVQAYLYAQRVAMDKAQVYAERARDVVATDPFLDENNRVPLSTYAKTFFLKGVEDGKEDALKHLAKVGGLWVFFDSTCSFCQTQIYSVQELAKRHGFLTKYISMDGKGVPGLKSFVRDNGHARMLNLSITPTTVLVVPPNGYYIVSQGMMAESQLGDRLVLAADAQNLLPKEVTARVRAYDRGVLTPDDTKTGASQDPKEWVKYLQERLSGRY